MLALTKVKVYKQEEECCVWTQKFKSKLLIFDTVSIIGDLGCIFV